MERALDIFELENMLGDGLNNIGSCIGLVDQDCWKFLIYLGGNNLLVTYEKGNGVIKKSFDYLYDNMDKYKFEIADEMQTTNLDEFKVQRHNLRFFKYDMNIFTTSTENKIKPIDFVRTIEFNLNQIETLKNGDIIMFERGLYHHAAILIDHKNMLCIHRSGEPDDPGNLCIASSSILGLPTEKASVTEDHLIEIAGYSRLKKSNEVFDKKLAPTKTIEEIVNEAKNRLGEKGYSVTSKNCQHFVSDIRNGTAYSPELDQLATGALYSGFFGLMSVGLAIAGKYLINSNKKIESKESITKR